MKPPTPHPRSAAVQSRRISRIPAFTPVTVRARRDGWTPERQAEFIGYLAETRCVKRAASKVGMSRESAYRLRRKAGAEGFCAAWDAILGPPWSAAQPRSASRSYFTSHRAKPKVTLEALFRRTAQGTYRPVLRNGRYAGTLHKPDDSALRSLLGRLDRLSADPPARYDPRKGHGKEKPRSA
ncbi:MAG: hypothetical protein AAGE05_10005 [Pseudomonadota bacterium]